MDKLVKKIFKQKKKEIAGLRRNFDANIVKAAAFSVGGEFRSIEVNVQQASVLPVIAELKSKFILNNFFIENFDPLKIARKLAAIGMDTAVIVATDTEYLGGDTSWINLVKLHTELPVIRRDFFMDPVQIYQSKAIGADGILLDLNFTESDQIIPLLEAVQEMGMESFIQVPDETVDFSIDPELYMGLIVNLPEHAMNTAEAYLAQIFSSVPEEKIKWVRANPKHFEDILMIHSLNMNGVILNDNFWMAARDFEQHFSRVGQWIKMLEQSR